MPKSSDQKNIDRRTELGYSETMSTTEIDEILSRARSLSYLGLKGDAWECVFALFWAFGKRVSEIVGLRVSDIAVRGINLAVTFTIRKKRGGARPRRTKILNLENKYAIIIQRYWNSIRGKQTFLFPRSTKMGHIYPKYVWDAIQLMEFEQPVWTHLFRHSLATELAANEISAWEMKEWFDWEKIDTADEYVSSSGVGTKKISARNW